MPEQHRHREVRRLALGDPKRLVFYCGNCGSEEIVVSVSAYIDPNNWFLMDDGNVMENIHESYCPACKATSVPVELLDRHIGDRTTYWTKEGPEGGQRGH